jgi:hypothetical protein
LYRHAYDLVFLFMSYLPKPFVREISATLKVVMGKYVNGKLQEIEINTEFQTLEGETIGQFFERLSKEYKWSPLTLKQLETEWERHEQNKKIAELEKKLEAKQ